VRMESWKMYTFREDATTEVREKCNPNDGVDETTKK